MVGNLAYIKGYVSTPSTNLVHRTEERGGPVKQPYGVAGVMLYRLEVHADMRGKLVAGELAVGLPFTPLRYFFVFDVPSREVRGEHAHRTLDQFLVCAHGECAVIVDDGEKRSEISLNEPMLGLHIPPMVWGTQYKFSSDAVLLVLASGAYDSDDYIGSYDDFLRVVSGGDRLRVST